jgi:hypothetical protein
MKIACILPKAVIRMLPSRQIVARSEDRKYIMRISPISWAGLEWPNPFAGIYAYFTPASPTNRVFLWARFDLTARKRQQVRNPCSGLLVSVITRDMSMICTPLRPRHKTVLASTTTNRLMGWGCLSHKDGSQMRTMGQHGRR